MARTEAGGSPTTRSPRIDPTNSGANPLAGLKNASRILTFRSTTPWRSTSTVPRLSSCEANRCNETGPCQHLVAAVPDVHQPDPPARLGRADELEQIRSVQPGYAIEVGFPIGRPILAVPVAAMLDQEPGDVRLETPPRESNSSVNHHLANPHDSGILGGGCDTNPCSDPPPASKLVNTTFANRA